MRNMVVFEVVVPYYRRLHLMNFELELWRLKREAREMGVQA
jgi:hypothetical protein